jgi:MFS transporter, ACS family, DAL5 transporter family protein
MRWIDGADEHQDGQLLWKLDLVFIPRLSLLYLCSFLDRTNIGNAKLDGLQGDLHMSDGQYNAALTIFFVSYSVFEPITNILLRRTRPSIFIPTIMVLWVSRALFLFVPGSASPSVQG